MTRVVVLADTHIVRGGRRRLPNPAYAALEGADLVLHAGDVLVPELLEELGGFAPVHAVLGNNDHELVGSVPERVVVDVDGVTVAMIHDSGPSRGRAGRLHAWFPKAAVVVFGHSHIPWDGPGVGGQLLFNPGSPTERRTQPHPTIGVLDVEGGRVLGREVRVV